MDATLNLYVHRDTFERLDLFLAMQKRTFGCIFLCNVLQ